MTQQLKKIFACPTCIENGLKLEQKYGVFTLGSTACLCSGTYEPYLSLSQLEALLNEMFAAKIAEYNYPKAPHCVEVLEGLQIDILNQIKGEG